MEGDSKDTLMFASRVFVNITFMMMVMGSINLYCLFNVEKETLDGGITISAIAAVGSLISIVVTHKKLKNPDEPNKLRMVNYGLLFTFLIGMSFLVAAICKT